MNDLVGVDLDYCGSSEMVVHPYALYIALGSVDHSAEESLCLDGCNHYVVAADDRSQYEHPDEYNALCHITSSVLGDSAESGYPDKFAELVLGLDWEVAQVRATGVFSLDVYEDDDLVNALRGNEGGAQVLFHGSASTKVVSQWGEFRRSMAACLAGNDDWMELVGGWLDAVAGLPVELDVTVHIYNPCDLLATLVLGLPESLQEYHSESMVAGMAEYVPMVYATAVPRDRDHYAHELRGILRWNGKTIPDLRDRVERVYPDGLSWQIARWGGTWWQNDRDLLRMLGMRYLAEWAVLAPLPQRGFEQCDGGVLLPSDLDPATVQEWGGWLGLASFIERHRDEILLLAHNYRRGWIPGD
ncbi:hypothetical protein ABZ297_24855 [Nonomuraea sp. NPDC005983]|uniref:hypothetical protein n=1 Tax=Nonomuraea sp. NPDC005983 TaxID=3155595 RepID=UPI0033ACE4B7